MYDALAVKLCQQLPNYRKPASLTVRESYPLPPYSSVIGMVHSACGWKEYHALKLSIQGKTASDVMDLAVMYNFGIPYEEGRHQAFVENAAGGRDGINRTVRRAHLLADVELILHIVPEKERDFGVIFSHLICPDKYISLGRYEDLVRIDSVDAVCLEPVDPLGVTPVCTNDIYVPCASSQTNPLGTVYRLNKVFHIDEKNGIRVWDEVVEVRLVTAGSLLNGSEVLMDHTHGVPVCLA